jgi:hypothetical protein
MCSSTDTQTTGKIVHELQRFRLTPDTCTIENTFQLGPRGFVGHSELFGRLPVERDQHFVSNKPLSIYTNEARIKGRIVA